MIIEITCIGIGFGAGVVCTTLYLVEKFNKLHREIGRLEAKLAINNLAEIFIKPIIKDVTAKLIDYWLGAVKNGVKSKRKNNIR